MTASAISAAIAVESTRATTAEGLKASQANTYTKTETDSAIQAVVGAAPEALNTLAEIATQLASDESAAAALVNTVATKVDKVAGKGLSTEDYTTAEKAKLGAIVIPTTLPASDVSAWAKDANKPTYTATELGLGNVSNTSDLLKPISTATQTALDLKANSAALGTMSAQSASAIAITGGTITNVVFYGGTY